MRRLFALLIISTSLAAFAKVPPLRYADACSLTVINRALPDSLPYRRVNPDRYEGMSAAVARLYSYSSGLSVLFRTDSRYIYARWRTGGNRQSPNIPAIAQRGLDLYIMENGRWLYAGVAKPQPASAADVAAEGVPVEYFSAVCVNMSDSIKECMLNLPIYDELLSLEVGVEPDAVVEALDSPYRRRVVFVGSSITNGSGVSRPGMAYPGRIGRSLMVETPNLGASGNFRLDSFFADIVAETEADAFVFDAFSNPTAAQISERLEPFVAAVRAAHPTVPLIFIGTLVRPKGNFNLKVRAAEEAKREAARRAMAEVVRRFEGVYYIDPGMPIGTDGEATADGIHPTDMGFDRMLSAILPRIEALLREHGILE